MKLHKWILLPTLLLSILSCGSVDSLTSQDLPPAELGEKVQNSLETISARVIGSCESHDLNFKYLSAGGVYDSSDLANIKTYSLSLFLNEDESYQVRLIVYDQAGTKLSDDILEGPYTVEQSDFQLIGLGKGYLSVIDNKARFVLNPHASFLPSSINGKLIQMRAMTSPNGLMTADEYCTP